MLLENLIIALVNCHSIKNTVDEFANPICLVKPSIVIGKKSWLDDSTENSETISDGCTCCAEIETAMAEAFFYWFITDYRAMHLTLQRLAVNLSGVKCL